MVVCELVVGCNSVSVGTCAKCVARKGITPVQRQELSLTSTKVLVLTPVLLLATFTTVRHYLASRASRHSASLSTPSTVGARNAGCSGSLIAHGSVHQNQIFEESSNSRMIWAMHSLVDLAGSCGERKGISMIAHGRVQLCQIVEGGCSIRMIWPQHSLMDLEGLCEQG